jgi:nucleoid DNA-binding protein
VDIISDILINVRFFCNVKNLNEVLIQSWFFKSSDLNDASSGSVQIAGIGKLKLGERAEGQGRNPSTGEAITIKASKTMKILGGKRFKDSFQQTEIVILDI